MLRVQKTDRLRDLFLKFRGEWDFLRSNIQPDLIFQRLLLGQKYDLGQKLEKICAF